MAVKRASFWLTVAGVSVLAHFGLELVRAKAPSLGLDRFVSFVHRGPGGGA